MDSEVVPAAQQELKADQGTQERDRSARQLFHCVLQYYRLTGQRMLFESQGILPLTPRCRKVVLSALFVTESRGSFNSKVQGWEKLYHYDHPHRASVGLRPYERLRDNAQWLRGARQEPRVRLLSLLAKHEWSLMGGLRSLEKDTLFW